MCNSSLSRLFLHAVIPPVYLSLSSANYFFDIPEISLSSLGKGADSSLVCHTDSSICCRQLDSGMEGGIGEWYYPNGSAISADSEKDGLYVSREQMKISLSYRSTGTVTVEAGLYCCAVPTTHGLQIFCVKLGE